MLTLDVYLEAVKAPVGKLTSDAEGSVTFQYTTLDLPHPISMSLPIQTAPYGDVLARGFFANLLFENEMRDAVMQRYGIDERDIVGLLYHLGSDCPGAISCVPEGAAPGKRPGRLEGDYKRLSGTVIAPEGGDGRPVTGELRDIMVSLRDNRRLPPQSDDPSPLAGVQGKVALTLLPDGTLAIPKKGSGAPTTHILKVPRRAQMSYVVREHLAMQLMAQIQSHPVAPTRAIGEGDLRGLLITRFDRRVEDGRVYRIHQEDFCQALGLGHGLKYERYGAQGRIFSATAVGQILNMTRMPAKARQAFIEITLINLALGNSDNHAKNHALLYTSAKPELAPAYDIDPVILDDVNHEMAFRIGNARMVDEINQDDLNAFGKALGMRGFSQPQLRRCGKIFSDLLKGATELPRPQGKRLCDAIHQQIHHLSDNLDLGLEVPEFDAVPVNRP
ncbi:MAG: HipA domain-containing protein [Planktomarina sp.]